MEIDEKEITNSAVPDEKYEEATITRDSEMEKNDTSEETKSDQRSFRVTLSEDIGLSIRVNLDVEREEKKRFFSKINQEFKKIK